MSTERSKYAVSRAIRDFLASEAIPAGQQISASEIRRILLERGIISAFEVNGSQVGTALRSLIEVGRWAQDDGIKSARRYWRLAPVSAPSIPPTPPVPSPMLPFVSDELAERILAELAGIKEQLAEVKKDVATAIGVAHDSAKNAGRLPRIERKIEMVMAHHKLPIHEERSGS